jgi:hypothetical protein
VSSRKNGTQNLGRDAMDWMKYFENADWDNDHDIKNRVNQALTAFSDSEINNGEQEVFVSWAIRKLQYHKLYADWKDSSYDIETLKLITDAFKDGGFRLFTTLTWLEFCLEHKDTPPYLHTFLYNVMGYAFTQPVLDIEYSATLSDASLIFHALREANYQISKDSFAQAFGFEKFTPSFRTAYKNPISEKNTRLLDYLKTIAQELPESQRLYLINHLQNPPENITKKRNRT